MHKSVSYYLFTQHIPNIILCEYHGGEPTVVVKCIKLTLIIFVYSNIKQFNIVYYQRDGNSR